MPAIIVKGDYQAQAIRFLPPNTENLLYWGMYGKDDLFTSKNHKNGNSIITIGSPVYPDNNYAVLKGGFNYLKTGITQTPDQTFFSVFKIDTESEAKLILNYTSDGKAGSPPIVRGAGLDIQVGTVGNGLLSIILQGSVNVSGTDTIAPALLPDSYTVGSWCAIAGTINSTTGVRKVYNLTAGTSAQDINTYPISLGVGDFQIGSTPSTPPATDVNIAMSAIYSDCKTDAEVQAIYTKMTAYFAKRGISI